MKRIRIKKDVCCSLKTVSVLLMLLASISIFAQSIPLKINYQAKLMENGSPVTGTKSIVFTIGSWTETHSNVNVVEGLYSVVLGEANPIPASTFNTPTVQLEVAVEGSTLSPTTDIVSVAYAYQAQESENADKLDSQDGSYYSDFGNLTNVPSGLSDGDDVDDADHDPTNEIQTLSLSSNILSLSNGGGSVTLPSSGGSYVDLTTNQSIGGVKTFTNQNTNFNRFVNVGYYGSPHDAELRIYSDDNEALSIYNQTDNQLLMKLGYSSSGSKNEINSMAPLTIDCYDDLILDPNGDIIMKGDMISYYGVEVHESLEFYHNDPNNKEWRFYTWNGDLKINGYASDPLVQIMEDVQIQGDCHITGNLSKASGTFKIDHPMDPENKYLIHSFVESPDMMNVYNGNIITDNNGIAVVHLPSYFKSLNSDFRYQLTCIGVLANAIVKNKINNNEFTILTDKPNVEVSWQVTGIRKDAYANTHRIEVEVEKAPEDKGKYLHPDAFGLPETRSIFYEPQEPQNK